MEVRSGIFSVLLVAVIVLTAACSGGVPDSSLTIRDSQNNLLLATSQTQGVLQIEVGETRQIKVLRTFQNSSSQTVTDDVTQFSNFKWETNNVGATYDQLGNITAVTEGIAVLEVKFRTTSFERWDIARMTVQVIAAP